MTTGIPSIRAALCGMDSKLIVYHQNRESCSCSCNICSQAHVHAIFVVKSRDALINFVRVCTLFKVTLMKNKNVVFFSPVRYEYECAHSKLRFFLPKKTKAKHVTQRMRDVNSRTSTAIPIITFRGGFRFFNSFLVVNWY